MCPVYLKTLWFHMSAHVQLLSRLKLNIWWFETERTSLSLCNEHFSASIDP